MKYIAGNYIVCVQYIIALFMLFWPLLNLIMYFNNGNINYIWLCLMGTTFMSISFFLYSRLNEIKVARGEIFISNILYKKVYSLKEERMICRTFFSPFVYEIKISKQSFFFTQNYISSLKTIFSFDEDIVSKRVESIIKSVG